MSYWSNTSSWTLMILLWILNNLIILNSLQAVPDWTSQDYIGTIAFFTIRNIRSDEVRDANEKWGPLDCFCLHLKKKTCLLKINANFISRRICDFLSSHSICIPLHLGNYVAEWKVRTNKNINIFLFIVIFLILF